MNIKSIETSDRLICANCAFFNKTMDEGQDKPSQGECRRHPPQGQMMPVGVNKLTGQPMIHTLAFWPPCNSSQWCGDHSLQAQPFDPYKI